MEGSGDGLRREMSFPARHDASADLRRGMMPALTCGA